MIRKVHCHTYNELCNVDLLSSYSGVIIEMGFIIVLFFTVEVRLYNTEQKNHQQKYANSPIAKVTLPPIFLFLIDVRMQKHGPIGVVCLFLMHNIAPPTF